MPNRHVLAVEHCVEGVETLVLTVVFTGAHDVPLGASGSPRLSAKTIEGDVHNKTVAPRTMHAAARAVNNWTHVAEKKLTFCSIEYIPT